MEIRVLNYFLMTAREENITKAAQILHMTQPTLSRQLMQLEEELGVKLFHRSNHRIILTEEGMLLRRRAKELVELSEKTKNEFLQKEENISGELSIGCGEFHSMDGFADLLATFQEQYPLVRYDFYSGDADDIKEKIENGLLDFGVWMEPVDIMKYEFIRLKQKEQLGILTRNDTAIANKQAVSPEDLLERPLFIPGRELIKHEWEVWFGDYFEQVKIAGHFNLLYNVAKMVQKGMGDALCIRLDAQYEGLTFIPLASKEEKGTMLAWKKEQMKSPVAAAFVKFAKEYMKK